MGKKDPRVDAYIAKSAEFAQPIMQQLRKLVHQGCPTAEETIKWGMPFFEYKGPLCHFAAFKAHCSFGFWRDLDPVKDKAKASEAMGHLGRITRVDELPDPDVLLGYIRAAVARRDEPKPKVTAKPKPKKPALPLPSDLRDVLGKTKNGIAAFEAFSPSHQREYIEWISEAKRAETRARRIETAAEWILEGKSQNWRYEK